MLYAVCQSYEDYDRLQNSTFLLDLGLYLEQQKPNVTTVINSVEHSGKVQEIKCANGMLYSIANDDYNSGVTYQLQISVTYTVEVEMEE